MVYPEGGCVIYWWISIPGQVFGQAVDVYPTGLFGFQNSLPDLHVYIAVGGNKILQVVPLYYLLGTNAKGYFHVLEIYHGGVIVEIMDVGAHEHREYGWDDTVE